MLTSLLQPPTFLPHYFRPPCIFRSARTVARSVTFPGSADDPADLVYVGLPQSLDDSLIHLNKVLWPLSQGARRDESHASKDPSSHIANPGEDR